MNTRTNTHLPSYLYAPLYGASLASIHFRITRINSVPLTLCIALVGTAFAQSLRSSNPARRRPSIWNVDPIFSLMEFLPLVCALSGIDADLRGSSSTAQHRHSLCPFEGRYTVVMIDAGAASQTSTSTAQVMQWAQPGLTFT